MRRILIFAYYSYRDPVFQSAVLPYFLNFPERENYQFVLLTFEQARFKMPSQERREVAQHLLSHRIHWYQTTWHSGRFKLLKKAFDFIWGILLATFLILRFRCRLIYSEAFPGAVLGHYLSRLTGCRHVVHSFEPHTDYMVESGVWRVHSWEARLLRGHERILGMHADALLTATYKNIENWRKQGSSARFVRVPSCVDLEHFSHSPEQRMKMRAQLGIKEDEIALIYLGKFGGMYWDEELFTLFRACYRRAPELYHFIILSQDDLLKLREKLRAAGIPDERAHLAFVPLNQVPAYLAASDMGICAVRQFPSKRYCSPIKDGEYWANGLPVAIPTGVSDDYELTRENGLGVVIEETSTLGLELAAEDIHKWFQQHQASEVRARTRDFAARDRDVKVFRGVLNELFVELIS